MRRIKASEFARITGVSRFTVEDWCKTVPNLAFLANGQYWIRLPVLAKCQGLDEVKVSVLLRERRRWILASSFATAAGIPPRTMKRWCLTRRNFAFRVGRKWYLDPASLGASPDQVEFLERWVPRATSLVRMFQHGLRMCGAGHEAQ